MTIDNNDPEERLEVRVNGALFRAPIDLSVSPTPLRRILLIGACILDPWGPSIAAGREGVPSDHLQFNQLDDMLPRPAEDYDFQLIGIPLRSILPESSYFRLPYTDLGAFEILFDECCQRLESLLDYAMKYNRIHKILSFVMNFLTPVQNAMGRLMGRYDLRNPVYFMERLNQRLVEFMRKYENTYLLDIDQIAATLGRRFIQDDFVCVGAHGSMINDWDHVHDQARISPARPLSEVYEHRTAEFMEAGWAELVASYRTIRQIDGVKMVVMDLDDIMWRGVPAEDEAALSGFETEGWPLGVAEALIYLKRRGTMLAIVSKNDELKVERLWRHLMAGRLELSDFAFRRISWAPKSDSILEIITAANILPNSVVLVDDNPVERAAALAAIPGIRVIGSDPYLLKRVLLWSGETQVAAITDESARRTEMQHQQHARETARAAISREEFLFSLLSQVTMLRIDRTSHPSFDRVVELINKTNQFNTTGRRWQRDELWRWLDDGKRISAFTVEDRFSKYGLVGIVIHDDHAIEQFVMSCRVLGMEIEIAILARLLRDLSSEGVLEVSAQIIETAANLPCRDLYRRAGFTERGAFWVRSTAGSSDMAPHVKVVEEASAVLTQ